MSVVIDGSLGITTPAETVQGALTTTGNTILGDASTDTLNVGNGGLVKDASGNVGIGTASPASRLQIGDATVNTNNGIILGKYNAASEANLPAIRQISAGTGNDLAIAATSSSGALRFYTGGADSSLALGTASNAERMRIDSAGLLQFNSGYGSVATAYGCRAWVNFNGTGTVAIRASGNVSSITDNGTGNYVVNFTTAMVNVNYAIVTGTAEGANYPYSPIINAGQTTSSVAINLRQAGGTPDLDSSIVCVAIFR